MNKQKSMTIQIRLTAEEKEAFLRACGLVGIGLSSWVRERLRTAAIRELEAAGLKVPFVPAIHLRSNDE